MQEAYPQMQFLRQPVCSAENLVFGLGPFPLAKNLCVVVYPPCFVHCRASSK